jgi:hypothetical protein
MLWFSDVDKVGILHLGWWTPIAKKIEAEIS